MKKCQGIPWNHPWKRDDFDQCFRSLFIEKLLPASIVVLSVLVLVIRLVGNRRAQRYGQGGASEGYLPLLDGTRRGSGASRSRNRYGATADSGAAAAASNPMGAFDDEELLSDSDDEAHARVLAADEALQQHGRNPSRRDVVITFLAIIQIVLAYTVYDDEPAGHTTLAEVMLWSWSIVLCVYMYFRSSTRTPSPSPHLRLLFTVGFFIDFVKTRSAILDYVDRKHTKHPVRFPAVEMAMAAISLVLFLASFTAQRRRHGLPANAPVGASQKHPEAPEKTASIMQLMFFSWMDPMIWLGYNRPLEPNDVYDLMPEDRSMRVCAEWYRDSRDYVRKHGSDDRSLTVRLLWFFRYRLLAQSLWTLVCTVFLFTGPFLLKRILRYIEDPSIYTREQAYWCVSGLMAGGTVATVCQSQALWIGRKIGIQMKSIIIGEVYAKSLRRRDAATSAEKAGSEQDSGATDKKGPSHDDGSDDEDGASSLGKITNLMAVDAHKISEVASYMHFLYQLPAQIIITVVMLYQLLGMASIAGLGAILVLAPIQYRLVSVWGVIQNQLMKVSDRRMSLMNEILQGVRIIKFFAWERQFESEIASVRANELRVLRSRYLQLTYSILVFFMAPVFVTLATFGVYTKVMGYQLTASTAFTALALFKTLRGPIDQLPDFFSFCLQAKVSLDRVAKFMSEEETPKYLLQTESRKHHDEYTAAGLPHGKRPSYADIAGSTDIGFIGASFSWRSVPREDMLPRLAHPNAPGTQLPIPAIIEPENRVAGDLHASESSQILTAVHSTADTSSESDSAGFELRDITINFPVGKLSIIAGPTGCGKTSLLMALLGEMRLTGGKLLVPGSVYRPVLAPSDDPFAVQESVAYVAQQAWLLNDTIRGNITFGLPFDEARYNDVVRMCALARDFEIFDAGDMTEVGERGVALSGGQKQRISLARAVYSPARHVVMDDCLSAVDAHTAKHIYEHCLMAPAMMDRTRILVTHAVGLTIKGASMVVVMQDGRVAAAGSPVEVLRSGKLSEETLREADEEQQNAASKRENAVGKEPEGGNNKRFDGDEGTSKGSKSKDSDGDKDKGKLTTEEGWSQGHVQWRVYTQYLKASGGYVFWIILTLGFIITQLTQVAQDYWLREWAAAYSAPAVNTDTLAENVVASSGPTAFLLAPVQNMVANYAPNVDLGYYIGVYVLIAVSSIFCILLRSLLQFWGSLKASKELHEDLLHTVLRAPVRFFDVTPVGRLINRFSKDMETIDQSLISSLAIFITELVSSLAILVVIAVITPAFIGGAFVISVIYWIIGVLYLSASREIKRFESVTKSPIYTQFGETLNGVSTIRAYGQEKRFMRSNYAKIDDNIRPFIYMWGANRWLSIRVDLAGALVSFLAGLFALLATGRMDAGLAGLSLSYALNFTEHILWVVRFYSYNEMNLNSVERVIEYLDVEPEAPVTIPDRVPEPQWPTAGEISVENLVLKYAENLPPVIRGISFHVNPREKVGIVGRTGAGKSTLTLAMFRFMEASAGRIVVDGIDISQIGVGDLRSRLTIIPQDPVLFTGTIRTNLDPFNEHGDDDLWLALRRAHLLGDSDDSHAHADTANTAAAGGGVGSSRASTVDDGDEGVVTLGRTITNLDMAVMENGSNFSQGQRQLIALARALVKRTRVIILDEATASVDFDTDAKIQNTIRNEFTESTLLCIAHRLRTIVDYDKVLVLDQGQVVEYDTPYSLLKKEDGLFRHMCLKSGEYDYLFAAAERKHQSEH